MPSVKTLTTSLTLAIVLPISFAAPTNEKANKTTLSKEERGIFDIAPAVCKFGKDGTTTYSEVTGDALNGLGQACVAWSSTLGCGGDGPWDEQNLQDLSDVIDQQVQKDGQWESSTVGSWTATFELLTTAMGNREHQAFTDDLYGTITGKPDAVYWRADTDAIDITRTSC